MKTLINKILDGEPVRMVLESWLDGPQYDAWKTTPPDYDDPEVQEFTVHYDVIDFSFGYKVGEMHDYSPKQLLADLEKMGFATSDAKISKRDDVDEDGTKLVYGEITGVYYETELEGAWYGDDFEFEDPSPVKFGDKLQEDLNAFSKSCSDKYKFDVELYLAEPEYEVPDNPNDFGEPDEDYYRD